MSGDWITDFLEYTDNSEPPILYRHWVAVSAIASAMQRKCFLKWGEHLTFYPNMYIVLVGPSGVRKGTAMKFVTNIIPKISGIHLASEATTRQALIRNLTTVTNTEIINSKPKMHSSLTIHSEELTVFLGYNNLELIANLTDWYDCGKGPNGEWTYETIQRQRETILGIWVNLLGATTPELIQSSLPRDAIGGGLTSRMIFVYEERKGKSIALPFLNEDRELGEKLMRGLEKILLISGEYSVTEDFIEKYVDWYNYQETNKPFDDPKFSGYFERRPTHLLKLSMIMNASRNSVGKTISGQDFDKALDLLNRTEVKMRYTFSGVGTSPIAVVLDKVVRYIAVRGSARRSEIMNRFYSDMDVQTLDNVLATLIAMKRCRLEPDPSNPGNPNVVWVKES